MDLLIFACSNAIFCFLGAYVYHLGARNRNPLSAKEPEDEGRIVMRDQDERIRLEEELMGQHKKEQEALWGNGEKEEQLVNT